MLHRIVGTGLFALDVIVKPDGAVAKSTLGGSAGNVLSILSALGWAASPIGTLGDDKAADVVRQDFAAVGADLQFVRCAGDRHTPVIYQHQMPPHEASTHRFTFACPTCGQRRRPHWDDEQLFVDERLVLPEATVFFLDRPTRLGVALAQHYAERGSLVVFEPSSMGDDKGLFSKALRYAHIVKYADDRMSDLAGFDLQSVAVEIQTCGPRGLRFRAPSLDNDWLTLGAYELAHIGDTSGAGDWCTAGLIYDLHTQGIASAQSISYNSLTRALMFGQALSSLNCTTEGARGLLTALPPSRIIRSARELSSLRLRALNKRRILPSSQVCEPKLNDLAHTVRRLASLSQLGGHRFQCCPGF